MGRVPAIVALVGLSMVGGVAVASPVSQPRLPVTITNPATSATVVVVEGDHLWRISERHLGPGARDSEISPYWRRVIEVNLPGLRSGDPDLIYPGEVVELPAEDG